MSIVRCEFALPSAISEGTTIAARNHGLDGLQTRPATWTLLESRKQPIQTLCGTKTSATNPAPSGWALVDSIIQKNALKLLSCIGRQLSSLWLNQPEFESLDVSTLRDSVDDLDATDLAQSLNVSAPAGTHLTHVVYSISKNSSAPTTP